jgi:hypothetical protein
MYIVAQQVRLLSVNSQDMMKEGRNSFYLIKIQKGDWILFGLK